MKASIILAFLILNIWDCKADESLYHINREWRFPLGSGAVTISLAKMKSTIDGQEIYSLRVMSEHAEPSVHDETEFLGSVTRDMEKEGMQPQRIVGIIIDLRESEIRKRLSNAASTSEIWLKSKPSEYESAVVKLLNSIEAYGSFNKVFNSYGLKVEVAHAEYISLIKPIQSGAKNSNALALPSSATLQLILKKIKP
jgi:hypothetical protein